MKYACEVSFGSTKWDGKDYSQGVLGDESQLRKEILEHKLFVYKRFVQKSNPSTGKLWKTQDAILHVLTLPDGQRPSYLTPESSIVQQLLIKYLNILISTTTLECCFSTVKLVETPLCARCSEDQKNRTTVCYKEAAPLKGDKEASQPAFDVQLATTFWYHAGKKSSRRLKFPVSSLSQEAS